MSNWKPGEQLQAPTQASSTTKTSLHDIAESGIKHQESINQLFLVSEIFFSFFQMDLC
jgi:hypothetical protein